MPYADRLVVLALDASDAADWRQEHPELADDAIVVEANGRGWLALAGIMPTALVLGNRASRHGTIGGTNPPRVLALALNLAESRRPHVLREVA